MADNLDLESFRSKWREELFSGPGVGPSHPHKGAETTPAIAPKKPPGPHSAAERKEEEFEDDLEDGFVPKEEESARINYTGLSSSFSHGDGSSKPSTGKEPKSALEHYEKAVEKETQGSLGDSLNHYRKAYRLDPKVDKAYKKKYFPPSASKPNNPNPSNAAVTVPNPAHHSLEEPEDNLVKTLASLSIRGVPPPTEGAPAPPCPIAKVPSEVLIEILSAAAHTDVAAFVRLAQVCKFLNQLVSSEGSIWKRVCLSKEFGFASMHYAFACNLDGAANHYLEPPSRPTIAPSISWKHTFQTDPRIRFTGVYISTVNYTRPGASSAAQVSWNTPVLIVTYYRYLRFFRDGTCVSLLTTTEPSEVVHHLTKENTSNIKTDGELKTEGRTVSSHHPITKCALRGRWHLSDPRSEEGPGELHIETEGVDVKYMYSLHLAVRSVRNLTSGGGPKNTKLVWKGFWSYNRLTDDWGEFGLRNDRAFFFSTVRSYGMGQ